MNKENRLIPHAPTEDTLDSLELREQTGKAFNKHISIGFSWSMFNSVISRCGQLIVGIVLARLIAPEEFGVFAVALVALTFVFHVSSSGISLAVVRSNNDVDAIAPTVNTLAIAVSTLLTAICVVGAPWFTKMLGAPEATGVLRVLSISMLLTGPTAVPVALLTRAFRQDRWMAVDSAGLLVSAVVSIGLAAAGLGAMGLAWGRVVGHVVSTIMVFALAPKRYALGFDRSRVWELFTFGAPLTGASLLVFGVLNVDYIVVGSLLGATQLGLYVLAFNLSSWPVTAFSTPVRSVSLAGFSRMTANEGELRSHFVWALALLTTITVPFCVLLATLSQPLVRVVYGAPWAPAAGVLSFLVALGALRTALELAYDFLVALGETRVLLWLQALWFATLVPALVAGAKNGGIAGVGTAHMAVAMLIVTPAYFGVLRRRGVNLGRVGRDLVPPAAVTALVAVTTLGIQPLLHTDLLKLTVSGTVALGIHALAVLLLRKSFIKLRA